MLPAAARAEPFLSATGAKGILAEEEQRLFRLRQEKEGEARTRLLEEKQKLEDESRSALGGGQLCATPFGVDIVGITEAIAFVGALVGGLTARQRKVELERLNEQLRRINLSLRQQARAGTVYAPGLTYAPPMAGEESAPPPPPPNLRLASISTGVSPRPPAPLSPHTSPSKTVTTSAVAVAAPLAPPEASTSAPAIPGAVPGSQLSTLFSMEEDEMSSDQLQCRDALRAGKRLLKERNGAGALVRFEKALMLSKALADKVQERRAIRGLAAASRLQGQYKSAIKHLERVLEISKEMKEFTGDADAYGTIADCYTDMGEFEKAAAFYDKYIDTMNLPHH